MIINILDKTLEHIIEGNPKILKTGFIKIDELLENVDYGSLITISARPAMGKKAFILEIMYNFLKQNKNCLFISQGAGAEYISKRLLSNISGVALFGLKRNLDNEKIERLKQAKDELAESNLTILEYRLSIEQIRNAVELYYPEYVFIEGVDYMEDFNKSDKIDVLVELKNIAEENRCIFFTTCTLTDSVEKREDKRPTFSDLKETQRAYMVPDVVMFIYRNNYYYNTDTNKAEIIIASNKNGFSGIVELLFDSGSLRYSDIR